MGYKNVQLILPFLLGMSLDVYEGQITCFLGHRGAGKSTLINLLTGSMHADDGSATIYGCSIHNHLEMDVIRTMTGVCLQENTVFDYLSPMEHLRVFAGLKGVPDEEIEEMVSQPLSVVQSKNVACAKYQT